MGEAEGMMERLTQMVGLVGGLFTQSPDLHAEILQRIAVGAYVIDDEHTTGITMEGYPPEIHAIAVYRVAGNAIVHARLLF